MRFGFVINGGSRQHFSRSPAIVRYPIADMPEQRHTRAMSKQNLDDQWQDRWMADVCQLGAALATLDKSNPWPDIPLLPAAMNYLMTELWDRGFSQTQIREAFEAAARDLPHYAAGEEVRP